MTTKTRMPETDREWAIYAIQNGSDDFIIWWVPPTDGSSVGQAYMFMADRDNFGDIAPMFMDRVGAQQVGLVIETNGFADGSLFVEGTVDELEAAFATRAVAAGGN